MFTTEKAAYRRQMIPKFKHVSACHKAKVKNWCSYRLSGSNIQKQARMKLHSEPGSGSSLQPHARVFNLNTLRSPFMLYFVCFFFSKPTEENEGALCGTA